TTTMYGVGTCSGMNTINGKAVAGTTQLSIDGVLIPASVNGAVFNQAECQCQSRDINMHFFLTTPAGLGQPPPAVMYIGDSTCSDYSMRSTKQCDQVTIANPPNNASWMLNGTSFQSIAQFDVPIPPEVVTTPRLPGAPMDFQYSCDSTGVQNYTVTIVIG